MPNPFLYIYIVIFQTIQLSICTQFSSIWLIDRTLSGATTPDPSGPGSNGNEEILHIAKNSSITGVSPSDCLSRTLVEGLVLPLCREAVGVFYSFIRLGHMSLVRGRVLPLCGDAVGVFCSLSRLGHRTCFGGSNPSAEMQSVYSGVIKNSLNINNVQEPIQYSILPVRFTSSAFFLC